MSRPEQAREELAIFQKFMTCANLTEGQPYNQSEPEPDILFCANNGNHRIFEMTELVDRDFQHNQRRTISIKKYFEEYFDNNSKKDVKHAINSLFFDADIRIQFCRNVTESQRKASVPNILLMLAGLDDHCVGDVANDPIPRNVEKITITRGAFQGPCFDVAGDGFWIGDPTMERLKDKNDKNYKARYPVELLMYYSSSLRFPEEKWRYGLREYIEKNENSLQFGKIWVFDPQKEEILFEHEVQP